MSEIRLAKLADGQGQNPQLANVERFHLFDVEDA